MQKPETPTTHGPRSSSAPRTESGGGRLWMTFASSGVAGTKSSKSPRVTVCAFASPRHLYLWRAYLIQYLTYEDKKKTNISVICTRWLQGHRGQKITSIQSAYPIWRPYHIGFLTNEDLRKNFNIFWWTDWWKEDTRMAIHAHTDNHEKHNGSSTKAEAYK